MKRSNLILVVAALSVGLLSCSHHRVHQVKYYKKLGEENATNEGYHANEAQRLLSYNEENKEANDKHAEKTKAEQSKNLNEMNKPNSYNMKTGKKQAKRKKYSFYH